MLRLSSSPHTLQIFQQSRYHAYSSDEQGEDHHISLLIIRSAKTRQWSPLVLSNVTSAAGYHEASEERSDNEG